MGVLYHPRVALQLCGAWRRKQGQVGKLSGQGGKLSAEMYRQSGLVISREQGLRSDAGFAVRVLMS